jgi:hypothetical protein
MRKSQSKLRKLSLFAETLRKLTAHQLAVVKGGLIISHSNCEEERLSYFCPSGDATLSCESTC